MLIDEKLIQPSREQFAAQAKHGVTSVCLKLIADDITPIGVFRKLGGQLSGTFLFESAEQGVWSRWSFIGVNPLATLTGRDGTAHWHADRLIVGLPKGSSPLNVLGDTLSLLSTARDPDLPPLSSGMVGYLSYDLVRENEPVPDNNPDDIGVPEMVMMMAGDLAALDHRTGEIWLIANTVQMDSAEQDCDLVWQDAVKRIQLMAQRLAEPDPPTLITRRTDDSISVKRQRTPQQFIQMVEDAKEHIRAGDIFQVVPSQRFEVDTSADALAVYGELRRSNPSPYLYLLQLDHDGIPFALVGSSPEALVTVRRGRATTRPIAGSRPRGGDPASDRAMEQELLADPKERAEHLMLVDLGRNDLGRVCQPGTVEVTEFMKVHRYSHIMHMEASVSGSIRPGFSALDVTMSCFPAGTLSGAPKVRAMQIIDELEVNRRGSYGGVVGYFDFAGDSDVAIAIRTALITQGRAYVQAGAGVVADSVAEKEDAETQSKAAAVLSALSRASSQQILQGLESAPDDPTGEQ